MRIKKHDSGNRYIRAGNVWVRDFTQKNVSAIGLNEMYESTDYAYIFGNEELNKDYPKISDEIIYFKKIVVVSDGYDFDKRHLFLYKLDRDVAILAVNKALNKWKLMSPKIAPEMRRSLNAFVVNNPYRECMSYLPERDSKYYPTCVASIRTNTEFLKSYSGYIYTYIPTPDQNFGFQRAETYFIDDYRNPICACIGLAYRFGVEKLMFVCCDDSFDDKREAAVQLPNGLWTYEHHLRAHEIIDANLYWLTHNEVRDVKVANYSSGAEYQNAVYINNEEEALAFFMEQEEGTQDVQ
jgi:hypothetical protein